MKLCVIQPRKKVRKWTKVMITTREQRDPGREDRGGEPQVIWLMFAVLQRKGGVG